MDNLRDVRKEYENQNSLIRDNMPSHPLALFDQWYRQAELAGIEEPNAMTLASCTAEGKPSARIILLKGYSEAGFSFFTNYQSRKAREIISNPNVALVFWWKELHKQVRIEGLVSKMDQAISKAYFQSRPRESQISAWASPQSEVTSSESLEERWKTTESKFENIDILPLPEFWGGFLIKPQSYEFWQGKQNRYHDRFRYTADGDDHWTMERLAP